MEEAASPLRREAQKIQTSCVERTYRQGQHCTHVTGVADCTLNSVCLRIAYRRITDERKWENSKSVCTSCVRRFLGFGR